MSNNITEFRPDPKFSSTEGMINRAFVSLLAAILEEPEEVVLAYVLAKSAHEEMPEAA
jgi:hypothetical protein